MAVAWLDVGGHWGLTQYRRSELAELGYDVQQWGAGWTDDETGRLASLLDITGGARIRRPLSTGRWPDRE